MADRYDDYERSSQGRRGEWREEREGRDRGDFGREESEYGNRNRGGWENEQGQFGRGQMDRERYGQPFYGGQRGGEQGWEQRNPEWQRNRNDWSRERSGQEGPWGSGSQGFGTGPRSGEFGSAGSGGYTGFGTSTSESYYGGAGAYGQQRGRFSGKGPKGYQRSDDRIREDVCERLTNHPDVDPSEIEIKVNNGEVTLTGTVDERHAKRMVEEIAENVAGVKDVHNQVRVRERETAGAQHGKGETSGKETTGSQRR